MSYVSRYFSGQVGPTDLVVFLQNAWSEVYCGREWPRQDWLLALSRSRSGVRLAELTQALEFIPHNTTPKVSAKPSGIFPPDPKHIKRILSGKPRAVVACGRQAERALCKLWKGPLLAVPHPAHRLLTDALYWEGYDVLHEPLYCPRTGKPLRVALRQRRGEILREEV